MCRAPNLPVATEQARGGVAFSPNSGGPANHDYGSRDSAEEAACVDGFDRNITLQTNVQAHLDSSFLGPRFSSPFVSDGPLPRIPASCKVPGFDCLSSRHGCEIGSVTVPHKTLLLCSLL
ncbi:hypothetical protein GUJ93_ZPchr0011g27089 [Zizania palustris]|uniref:Uncharacterized protein n=1 Tax=Zizania palustris TaxID=103762 RepID=A0A8J6BSD1_ZIZPA|nr:hypothetical protein GUJ93_ZPchr0011g27089 [Zizania palustris]